MNAGEGIADNGVFAVEDESDGVEQLSDAPAIFTLFDEALIDSPLLELVEPDEDTTEKQV